MDRSAVLRLTLPGVCRALTEEKGIKLVFQGPPRTDGRVIYSNPMPVDASDEEIMMILGDIDHECGHILFSDFEFLRSEIRQLPSERQGLIKALSNAIEDTMEERRLMARFPGCQQTLGESVVLLEAEKGSQAISSGSPGDVLAHFIDAWGRVNVLCQGITDSLACVRDSLCELLGERAVRRIEALLATHLFAVDNTRDSFQLAYRVERFLEELEEDDPDDIDESAGDEGDQDTGDGSVRDKQASGNGNSNGGDPSVTGEGLCKNPNPGAKRILDDQTVCETPYFDRRQEAEESREAAASRHFVPTDKDTVFGQGAGDVGELSFNESGAARYAALRANLDGPIQQLTRSIVQLYQTATHRRWRSSEEGRIDGRRLALAVTGEMRVFRQRDVRTLPFPAVGLIIDASGSMNGAKMTLTQQAVIALTETNSRLSIPTAIHAFAGDDVQQIKGFDQSLGAVRARIGALSASGGTPMDQAIWKAGMSIARRKETRKLLFLVTDGMPDDALMTRDVSQSIRRMGIELFGLGIGTDAVSEYCPAYALIDDPTVIGTAILTAMRDAVLRVA